MGRFIYSKTEAYWDLQSHHCVLKQITTTKALATYVLTQNNSYMYMYQYIKKGMRNDAHKVLAPLISIIK